ncbi:MAG: T9SS type A sorting domain-containing protein [Clostridia bacterium]|nr:T9SS type A sorting domain-containing protein [Clostridia bacterium]
MKSFLLISLAFILAFSATAQEWSTPVNVSNMEGQDQMQDFYIDNSNTIHCVWTHMYSPTFSKIYYSKSYDDGSTWSTPVDLSQNNSMWCLRPHIVSNSENHLFVSYDYNSYSTTQSLIVFRTSDGSTWSDMDTVSEGMPGARKNKLIIDMNDRVYCFWYHDLNYGSIFYRILDNQQWSEIDTPFNDNNFYAASDVCTGTDNNIYLSGLFRQYGQNYDAIRTFFCSYKIQIWTDFTIFGDMQCLENAVTIELSNQPRICWRQYTSYTAPPNDGTFYAKHEGNNWSEPELIVEDPSEQIVIVDENNRSNIFDTEKTENGSILVHYYKLNDSWQGYIVAESDWSSMNSCAVNFNKKLYLMYRKPIDQSINSEILFTKSDIVSNVEEPLLKPNKIELKIYPNPFSQTITINFNTASPGKTTLKIYNLKGELLKVLLEKNLLAGSYEVQWDATTKKNVNVKSGLYLVRLQSGKHVVTHSLEYIK